MDNKEVCKKEHVDNDGMTYASVGNSLPQATLLDMLAPELRANRLIYPELEERYERLHIPVRPANHILCQPPRFKPKINKIRLAMMLFSEFWKMLAAPPIENERPSLLARWRAVVDRPCKYGAYSGRLGGFRPIQGKCVGCMRCLIEHPEVIEDILPNDDSGIHILLGWKKDDVETVLYEAATGKERVSGTGYGGPFAGTGWDSIWLDMSEIVRPTRDGKAGREYIATSIDIGRKPAHLGKAKPNVLTIQLPIIFDYMRETSSTIQLAIAEAAARCGTLTLVPISYFESLKNQYPNNLGLMLSEEDVERLRIHKNDLASRVVEVESTSPDVFERLKNKAPSSILVARLNADPHTEERVAEIAGDVIDGIHICADRNGYELAEGKEGRRHIKDVIRSINHALVSKGIRSEITLIGSGGIYLAEHVSKAIGCGLDVVAIDITVHVALQSEFSLKGDVLGISPRLTDYDWGAQRLTNIMAAWHAQLIEAMSAMGKRDARRLAGDEGRLIFYEEMRNEAFGGIEKGVPNA